MKLSDQQSQKQLEYDSLSDWFDVIFRKTEDFSYYLSLAESVGGAVLELGCGTGRLTYKLAQHASQVVGLDISQKQLARAAFRSEEIISGKGGKIDFRLGTMTDFSFEDRFRLILIPFSGVLELPAADDRVRCFAKCYEHLEPGGVLAFDNFFRGEGEHSGWGEPAPNNVMTFWGCYLHPLNEKWFVQHFESQRYEPGGKMFLTIFIDEVKEDGIVYRRTFNLTRQYATCEQTVSELQRVGFKDITTYGGFGREALYDRAVVGHGRLVVEARK